MRYRAEISARNEEGVMERVLRVCRHRGFWVHRIHADLNEASELVSIEIEGESERLPVLLMRQIEKLDEVGWVTVNRAGLDHNKTLTANERFIHSSSMERNRKTAKLTSAAASGRPNSFTSTIP